MKMEPAVVALRHGHVDSDAIAVLLRLDVDFSQRFLRRGAFLDDDLDLLAIPGPNLDGAVERRDMHVRLAGDREALFVALDEARRIGPAADDIDTTCSGQD